MHVVLATSTLVCINPELIAAVDLRTAVESCGVVKGTIVTCHPSGICRVILETEVSGFSFIDRESGNPCLDIHRMHLDVIREPATVV